MIKIVGICGKAGAGKSTVAEYLVKHYQAGKLAFADPLRAMLMPAIDLLYYNEPVEVVEEKIKAKKDEPIDCFGTSPRKLLQGIGALMREHNPDVFVKLTQRKIDMLNELDSIILKFTGVPTTHAVTYVIDDLRYDNEAQWIKDSGGKIFRLTRPEEMLRKVPKHHSENGVSDDYIDLEFNNDDNIDTIADIGKTIAKVCSLGTLTEKPIIDPRGSNSVH